MSDSRRLAIVVVMAQAGCTAVYSALCHGLYNTTEPIDAISALTRGSLHATAVAKTAQSSKTRVMGRHGEAQALPCGYCLSVPVALLQAAAIGGCMHAGHYHVMMPAHTYTYIQYIRNSSIKPLLGTHAGCSGRPPPYNGTLMHDSAQTHTHTHTTHQV
jgi:hypothetical protein